MKSNKSSIKCPHCGKRYNITDPVVGDKWNCPYCEQTAVITEVTTEKTVKKINNRTAFTNLLG